MIPRGDKSHIMIVSGEYKKEIGQLIQRNKGKEEVTVQLLSDRSGRILRAAAAARAVGRVEEHGPWCFGDPDGGEHLDRDAIAAQTVVLRIGPQLDFSLS